MLYLLDWNSIIMEKFEKSQMPEKSIRISEISVMQFDNISVKGYFYRSEHGNTNGIIRGGQSAASLKDRSRLKTKLAVNCACLIFESFNVHSATNEARLLRKRLKILHD